jgi:hypothetical protein
VVRGADYCGRIDVVVGSVEWAEWGQRQMEGLEDVGVPLKRLLLRDSKVKGLSHCGM